MKRFIAIFFFVCLLLITFPLSALAVDYSITNVEIKAYLQENGDVQVEEIHTYDFDSAFNGITREIIPKKGAEITGFMAKEGENPLRVEQEKHVYKIYRKGDREKITIRLFYVIKNGVEKHQDLTEFYWPFFDKRNESDYENLSITIFPPKETDRVIAFGYDSAFNKQTINRTGSVTFYFGYVPSKTNGDIRVAYSSDLFPAMVYTTNEKVKEHILQEKLSLEKKVETYMKNQEKTSQVLKSILPLIFIVFFIVLVYEYIHWRQKKQTVIEELAQQSGWIPKEKVSMPAVILHTSSLSSKTIPVAVLDLVRKRYVKQLSEDEFQLVHTVAEHYHEKILIDWLFYEVGWKGYFQLQDLKRYIKKESNLTKYQQKIYEWKKAVKEELTEFGVKEGKGFLRLLFTIFSVLFLCCIIMSIYYDLVALMLVYILLFIFGIGMIFFYRPLSIKGMLLKEEWHEFSKRSEQWSQTEWEKLKDDDQMRGVIYQMGIASSIEEEEEQDSFINHLSHTSHPMLTYYFVAFPLFANYIHQADKQYERLFSSSNSSSSSSFSGGGVGGGGGGSGAF